jgi:hypothetical protein
MSDRCIRQQQNQPRTIEPECVRSTEPRFSITSYSCPRCRNITGLLVYRVTDTELEEFEWFTTQMKQCLDEEEVEELIESIHRTDAL